VRVEGNVMTCKVSKIGFLHTLSQAAKARCALQWSDQERGRHRIWEIRSIWHRTEGEKNPRKWGRKCAGRQLCQGIEGKVNPG